jgi:hypothetical protein
MTIRRLIEKLSKLPPNADIYVEAGDEASSEIGVEAIMDDNELVGYLIFDNKQMNLPIGGDGEDK